MNRRVKNILTKQAPFQIIFGLLFLIIAEILMFRGTEPFASWFYPFAWWSYILIVDGIVFHLQENSLLVNRKREFLVMIPWSVSFWLMFEVANIRLENWHYAGVTGNLCLRWLGYFASFATVLPGIFETYELLECLKLFSFVKTRTRLISRKVLPIFFGFGSFCILFPLLFPRFCFSFIWLGIIFLLEPINYLKESRSLLKDWEGGNPRTVLLLMTAGLICGFFWEFWNFWAKTKWVYTLPFFNQLKIYEMPVAGFFGFLPFAVEAFIFYNFISLFRFKRNWDKNCYGKAPGRSVSGIMILMVTIVSLGFYALGFCLIDLYTVQSYSSPPIRIHSTIKSFLP